MRCILSRLILSGKSLAPDTIRRDIVPRMAVVIDVMTVATKRGLAKPYDLAKKMGTTYTIAQRYLERSMTQINVRTLDALCEALDCSPGDIIKRVPDKKPRK